MPPYDAVESTVVAPNVRRVGGIEEGLEQPHGGWRRAQARRRSVQLQQLAQHALLPPLLLLGVERALLAVPTTERAVRVRPVHSGRHRCRRRIGQRH